jgi:AraC-like DNA-binding protein
MDRGLNLRETAAEVGYLDDKALIRAFKRYEGTTPGRFREAR